LGDLETLTGAAAPPVRPHPPLALPAK